MADDAGISTYTSNISGNPVYDDDLRTAPWQIDKADFASSEESEVIRRTLNVIKNDHVMLVLASTDGKRYGNTILISYDEDTLSIDKPIDFDEKSISDLRIYFKDISGVWSFFETKVISDCPYNLCATYPEVLYRLKRRRKHRVELPAGTRTVFWVNDEIYNGGYVKDISASGMLICTGCRDEKFNADSTISDIAIALPGHSSSEDRDEEGRIILPVIDKGMIVRSFREDGTDFICHGVAFCAGDNDSERIEEMVDQIRSDNGDAR